MLYAFKINIMKAKYYPLIIVIIIFNYSFSQQNTYLKKNANAIPVNYSDIKQISINSEKERTILYSFGIWCAPCKEHLKNALSLAEYYNIDLYILLIEKEDDPIIKKTIDYLKNVEPTIKILILKDDYGKKRSVKYKRFLKEITPDEFDHLYGMSKYIVFNNDAEIIMVTTWKDNVGNDWKDDSNMLKHKVIPLLKEK